MPTRAGNPASVSVRHALGAEDAMNRRPFVSGRQVRTGVVRRELNVTTEAKNLDLELIR